MLDQVKLAKIIENNRYLWVGSFLGADGQAALRQLFASLHQIFRYIEPGAHGVLFVVMPVGAGGSRRSLGKFVDVNLPVLAQQIRGGDVLEVLANGQFRVYHPSRIRPQPLSRNAVVYEYQHRCEYLWAGGKKAEIEKPDPAYDSIFSVPAFSDLREAVQFYKTRLARCSSCRILGEIWHDKYRVFLKAKPESCMRNSLWQHLHGTLRGDCEVRPEQVVDESHPVDIKVTWWCANRLALIEIKWLGDSRPRNGHPGTKYRDSRARDGAKQLAEYLDGNRPHAPGHVTRGTLVVFDARRGKIGVKPKKLARANGFAYEHSDIVYNPPYHQIRQDFEEPIRMFLEPICR